MENGTIIQIKNRDWGDWKSNLVCGMIEKITGSDVIHSQVVLNNIKYETAHPGGFQSSPFKSVGKLNDSLSPIREMTDAEVTSMVAWYEDKIRNKRPYNYIKLFACLLLSWTKPFWQLIGYVPFSHKIWGDFCSAGVDEAFKFIGWDLLPEELEAFTAPGDLYNSVLHKKDE